MPNKSHKRYRSRSRSENEVLKKLLGRMDKRLRTLENKNRHKRQIVSSSDEESSSDYERDRQENYAAHSSDMEIRSDTDAENTAVQGEEFPRTSLENIQTKTLDEGWLAILGDDVSPKTIFGQPLQPEIAERWLHIAKNGLEETVVTKLKEKYPLPENGTLLGPPKLNLMVKQAIHESVDRRDDKLAKIQSRLAASLSAVGQVMTKILEKKGGEEDEEVKQYIETLNDAGRLIVDVIHSESISRRELVTFDLNKNWKNTLSESPLDNWLFGKDLEERLKAAKELQASSSQLRVVRNTSGKNTVNTTRSRSLPHLNYKSLPHHQQGAKQGRRTIREAPRNRHHQGKTWDRNQFLNIKPQAQDRERGNRRFTRH